MRYILLLFFTFIYANALNLSLNTAKQNGLEYAVVHLKDKEPILCESKDEPLGLKLYLCMFKGKLENKITDKITPFADISFVGKKDRFYIYIKPKFKSKLINSNDKLYENKNSPIKANKELKHISILIYKKPPFKQGKNYTGINFPVTYNKMQYPSVGALDLNDKPIDYAKTNDINIYLSIKDSYKNGYYEDVIKQTKQLVKNYPKSIFIADSLLYRLKSLDKLLSQDEQSNSNKLDKSDLAKEAKIWLKTFPTDKNIPEVLALTTKSYLDMGFKSDANYFLDILVSEFPGNRHTQLAILDYADHINQGKTKKKALKLYEDVLYSSKDIDVASEAAIRLAKNSLKKGNKKEAKKYLDKVLKANRDFIFKDKKQAYELAKKLYEKELYSNAATIINILLKDTSKVDEHYELMLKDAGVWNEKAKNINKAYELLKRYQKEFKYGEYNKIVEQSLDRLFFELNETNTTKLSKYYDTLIDRYQNDISQKALEQKALLLLKQKKYFNVLELKEKYPQESNNTSFQKSLNTAAYLSMKKFLKEDKCIEVMILAKEYEPLLSKLKDKPKLFECFLRTKRLDKAQKLCEEKIKDDNLVVKLSWLLKLEKALFQKGEYQKTIQVAKDIQNLSQIVQNPKINEALYERFFALCKLKRYEEALDIASQIEQKLQGNFRNVEVYALLAKMAKNRQDDLVATTYAKKAIDLQKKANSYILSPDIEYDYIVSLHRLKRDKEAKNVALSVLQRGLSKKQRGRALYVVAESYMKLGDEQNAKDFFKKCVNFDDNSSYKDICKENLLLYENEDNKTKQRKEE